MVQAGWEELWILIGWGGLLVEVVLGVASNFREKVLKPPDYDPRNIVDLIDKYGDAHINDSGWREVDSEEWFCGS